MQIPSGQTDADVEHGDMIDRQTMSLGKIEESNAEFFVLNSGGLHGAVVREMRVNPYELISLHIR